MAATEQYFNLVSTSKSSWVAVPNRAVQADNVVTFRREAAPAKLFNQTQVARVDFAERFPRLTIALISFALLAVSMTAEVEWLHQAGYFWR